MSLALVKYASVRWLCLVEQLEGGVQFRSVDGSFSVGMSTDMFDILHKANDDLQILKEGERVVVQHEGREVKLTYKGGNLTLNGLIIALGQFKEAERVSKKGK